MESALNCTFSCPSPQPLDHRHHGVLGSTLQMGAGLPGISPCFSSHSGWGVDLELGEAESILRHLLDKGNPTNLSSVFPHCKNEA